MWHRWLIVLLFLSLVAPLTQAATTPTADFTDNGDGTVTHQTTGLTWKHCAEGMSWTGTTCSGSAQFYSWAQATALTTTFAGHGDWRLPTIAELVTIVERESYNPAINTTVFPGTPVSLFWSASAYAGVSDHVWFVDFYLGYDGTTDKPYHAYVRLVRGGQLYPSLDFTASGDSVTHNKTGLTWKRCSEGMTWTGSTCTGSANAYTWSAANALTTSTWRLPTLAELQTIVEWSKYNPAINSDIFPNTPSSYFWSASAYADNSDGAWDVDFYSGHDDTDYKTDGDYVRLVRGGQSAGTLPPSNNPPTAPVFVSVPSSSTVNTPTQITVQTGVDPEGAQVNANCTATNSDHSDSAHAALSGLGNGGRNVQHSFTFNATGTQTIYCTSFDASGNASSTASKTISVAGLATNQPPLAVFTASPTSGTAPLTVNLDASDSSDPDGSIMSYTWNASGGQSASGRNATLTFTQPGNFTITLTVADNKAATASTVKTITVAAAQVANKPPVASFTATPTSGTAPLTVSLDASKSSDPDGIIASYTWYGSDGQSANGRNATLTFTQADNFTITLVVADDKGVTATTAKPITVTAAQATNKPPTAPTFLTIPSGALVNMAVNVTVQAGIDPEGEKVKVNCTATNSNHSDSAHASSSELGSGGRSIDHSFIFYVAGAQNIFCTSFDKDGNASSTVSNTISVAGQATNQPPEAWFTATPTSGTAPLTVSLDASASRDTDGNILSYAWSGAQRADGQKATLTFTQAGIYPITLTVTDNLGVSTSTTLSIRVAAQVANKSPSAPAFLAIPFDALVNVEMTVTVQAGVDPEGAEVQVNCIATHSNHPDSAHGSLTPPNSGGHSVDHSFTFNAAGMQMISCTSFDKDGNASSTTSKTVTVGAAVPSPLAAPITKHKIDMKGITVSWNAMPDAKSYMFYYAPADSAGRMDARAPVSIPLPASPTTFSTPLPAGFEGFYAVASCRNSNATNCGVLSNQGYVYLPKSRKTKGRIWNEQATMFFSARKAWLDAQLTGATVGATMVKLTLMGIDTLSGIETIAAASSPTAMLATVACSSAADGFYTDMCETAFGDNLMTVGGATLSIADGASYLKAATCAGISVAGCLAGDVVGCSASTLQAVGGAANDVLEENSYAQYGRELMEGILAQEYLSSFYRFDGSKAAVNQSLNISVNASITDAIAEIAKKYHAKESYFINFLWADSYRPEKVEHLINVNWRDVDKAFTSQW